MDDSTKKLLSELYKLTQQNRELLIKIDRRQRWGTYWKVFLFVVTVASALGVYYYFQPYVDQFVDVYAQFQKTFVQFGTIPEQLRNLGK